MAINSIPGTQTAPAAASSQTGAGTALTSLTDFNSFLKLFITQLKYQDPLSPASQEEFLAQTAQFSSVEQLMNLNQKISDFSASTRATAASLIGRSVEGKTTDNKGAEVAVRGLVTAIDYGDNGSIILGLQDGTALPFSNITAIYQA